MSASLASAERTVPSVPQRAIGHSLCSPADRAAQHRPAITTRPLIGILAVLLGALISTLDSRITTFGLADVRGAVHAGFDEGAWIPTAFTVGQMLMGPVSVWLGMVFGPRRLLMISSAIFTISNLLLPFSPDLRFVLAFQMVSGLASGTFIPLTIGFVAQNLPPRFVVYGVAAYVLNLELSLNIAASIEGWFSDNWVVEVDFLGHGPVGAADVGLHPFRNASPADKPRAAQNRGLVRDGIRGRRIQPALRRAGPGQPARLAEFPD